MAQAGQIRDRVWATAVFPPSSWLLRDPLWRSSTGRSEAGFEPNDRLPPKDGWLPEPGSQMDQTPGSDLQGQNEQRSTRLHFRADWPMKRHRACRHLSSSPLLPHPNRDKTRRKIRFPIAERDFRNEGAQRERIASDLLTGGSSRCPSTAESCMSRASPGSNRLFGSGERKPHLQIRRLQIRHPQLS